jgi:hypothetical protein
VAGGEGYLIPGRGGVSVNLYYPRGVSVIEGAKLLQARNGWEKGGGNLS